MDNVSDRNDRIKRALRKSRALDPNLERVAPLSPIGGHARYEVTGLAVEGVKRHTVVVNPRGEIICGCEAAWNQKPCYHGATVLRLLIRDQHNQRQEVN